MYFGTWFGNNNTETNTINCTHASIDKILCIYITFSISFSLTQPSLGKSGEMTH